VAAVACVIVSVMTFVGATAPAGAASSTRLTPGDQYVALGSSFASGPLIPEVADQSCLRSTNNYANIVARTLKLALTDVSCGASTTDNVVSIPQGVHPLQIDAVTPDTKLVTITTGGNDVNYTASNLICASDGAQGNSCIASGSVNPTDIETLLTQVGGKMVGMIEAIKEKAPKARIVVLPYPRVLPPSGTPCPPSVPMLADDLKFMLDVSSRLHTAIKDAAKQTKVDFVDSYAPKGHDACASGSKRWIQGRDPSTTALTFHPNGAGMQAQAAMILKALKAR
jgi:lysophospholipase L1-like esterase